MKDSEYSERAFRKIQEADQIVLAGECLGAMKADLVFPRLCWLLFSQGKKLTVCGSEVEEYRVMAEGADEGEPAGIFAKRCLHRLRNLEEQGCLEVRKEPFSGERDRRVLILMDRKRIPEWAAGEDSVTLMEIEDDGRLKILPQREARHSLFSEEERKERMPGNIAAGIGRIRDLLTEWILEEDF